MAVPGSLPMCIRVMIHWNTDKRQQEIEHIYVREAKRLRPDLTKLPAVDWEELEAWINEQMKGGSEARGVRVRQDEASVPTSSLSSRPSAVPETGLEPARPCGHMDLNHARLPIPPLRLEGRIVAIAVGQWAVGDRSPRRGVRERSAPLPRRG